MRVGLYLSMAKVICLRACQSSTGFANIRIGRFPETSDKLEHISRKCQLVTELFKVRPAGLGSKMVDEWPV